MASLPVRHGTSERPRGTARQADRRREAQKSTAVRHGLQKATTASSHGALCFRVGGWEELSRKYAHPMLLVCQKLYCSLAVATLRITLLAEKTLARIAALSADSCSEKNSSG